MLLFKLPIELRDEVYKYLKYTDYTDTVYIPSVNELQWNCSFPLGFDHVGQIGTGITVRGAPVVRVPALWWNYRGIVLCSHEQEVSYHGQDGNGRPKADIFKRECFACSQICFTSNLHTVSKSATLFPHASFSEIGRATRKISSRSNDSHDKKVSMRYFRKQVSNVATGRL